MTKRAKRARPPERRGFRRGEKRIFIICERGVFGVSGWWNQHLWDCLLSHANKPAGSRGAAEGLRSLLPALTQMILAAGKRNRRPARPARKRR